MPSGNWSGESTWGGIATGMVGLTELSAEVPEEVRNVVQSERERLASGEWDVFNAPVTYQAGNTSFKTRPVDTRQDLNRTDLLNMREKFYMDIRLPSGNSIYFSKEVLSNG